MHSTLRALALACALVPAVAIAQSAPPTPASPPSPAAAPDTRAAPSPEIKEARAKMRLSCAEDVKKHCATVEPGKGGLQKCLQAHASEISQPCATARSELRALRANNKG